MALRDPESNERRLEVLRRGLIPFWAMDAKIAYSTTFGPRYRERTSLLRMRSSSLALRLWGLA